MPDVETFDAVVVGAGWAGLSVSQGLGQAGYGHVVLERDRICQIWRSQRWASFHMNTPNMATVLPGDHYEGPDPEGYMTRDEFVAMAEDYARRHRLPVREGVRVDDVRAVNGGYETRTPEGTFRSRHVVVASGNLNVPKRPAYSDRIPAGVTQIDGSDYRDAGSLREGAILVIGCGNSGGQIAEDIALSGRTVFLSTGRNGRAPRRYRGKDIIVWLTETGRMAMPRQVASGRGLVGATHTISLQSLSAMGITLLGRLSDVATDGTLCFDDTLAESAAFGDAMSQALRDEIDEFIARNGLDVPDAVPDPAETVAPRFPDPPILELDLAECGITTVIWSTGFRGDFSWLRVDGALDERGNPVVKDCASVPGIYFAGLDSLASLKAGTVLAAADETKRILSLIGAAG
ncbi:MAG: NAD(P)/FAD-dependent oxidoreductase [Silicimonas sp.]|nr:NAD(P)/FAD-dependent oxidoreductase [Silicimonas sp.]